MQMGLPCRTHQHARERRLEVLCYKYKNVCLRVYMLLRIQTGHVNNPMAVSRTYVVRGCEQHDPKLPRERVPSRKGMPPRILQKSKVGRTLAASLEVKMKEKVVIPVRQLF